MNPATFLAEFRRRGAVLLVDRDHLRCHAPRGLLTDEAVSALRQHKPALIALLTTEAATDPDGLRLHTALTLFDGELLGDMVSDQTSKAHQLEMPT